MAGYIVNRIIHALTVLLGVVSVTFVLMHVAGDPLAGLMPPGATPEVQARIRDSYGLNRSLPVQYLDYVTGALRGNFGDSWRQNRPALSVVAERLPATLTLAIAATVLAVALGGASGVLAGVRPGSGWDALARLLALLGQALPAFWLGTMLIVLFSVKLRWLPSSGIEGPASVALPALALAAFPAATLTRLMRAAMIETLGADFIRTARAKGLSRWQVIWVHALRNAMLPALAFTGLQAGFLLGGAVIVEGVFAYPGIGGLALDAVFRRDIPVVEAFVWTVALLILVVNIGADVLAATIDPRLREDGWLGGSVAG